MYSECMRLFVWWDSGVCGNSSGKEEGGSWRRWRRWNREGVHKIVGLGLPGMKSEILCCVYSAYLHISGIWFCVFLALGFLLGVVLVRDLLSPWPRVSWQ